MKNRRAFIIGIKSTSLSKKEKLFLKKYKPWGVILFARNLKKFEQIKNLTNDIRNIFRDKNYPILIDQEGGRVNRLNKLIETSISKDKPIIVVNRDNQKIGVITQSDLLRAVIEGKDNE